MHLIYVRGESRLGSQVCQAGLLSATLLEESIREESFPYQSCFAIKLGTKIPSAVRREKYFDVGQTMGS